VEWVLGRVSEQDGVTTILAHPACMWLADDFRGFESVCRRIYKYILIKIKNLS